MSPFDTLQTLITAGDLTVPGKPGEPAGNLKLRQEALDSFRRQGFNLNGREDWKYGNIKPLVQGRFNPLAKGHEEQGDLARLLPFTENHRLVFVNGVFDASLSALGDLPEGGAPDSPGRRRRNRSGPAGPG